MPILVVAASPGPPKNLSPHRVSHRWKLSIVATMERTQLDKGWPPYHPLVCALHLPNAIGPDLEPCEEERPLWGSILEHTRRKMCSKYYWTQISAPCMPYTHWDDVSCFLVVYCSSHRPWVSCTPLHRTSESARPGAVKPSLLSCPMSIEWTLGPTLI